jgi:hypothetical protein
MLQLRAAELGPDLSEQAIGERNVGFEFFLRKRSRSADQAPCSP